MPWKITRSDECPDSKPFAVVRQDNEEIEGCHETEEAAKEQMSALYATEEAAKSQVIALHEAEKAKKTPLQIADLLRKLADLIAGYDVPTASESQPLIPQSQSTLAPLDVPTNQPAVKVCKIDEDKQLVFGWASISVDKDGSLLVDTDDEVIEPDELEEAVYEYVLEAREAEEMHEGESIGRMVESLVVTPEKAEAMGLKDVSTTAWWFGVKVDDPEVFAKVKDGTYEMFSIGGTAEAEEVEAE